MEGKSADVSPYLQPSSFTAALINYFSKYDCKDGREETAAAIGSLASARHCPDGSLRKRNNFKHLNELENYRIESGETRFVTLIDTLQKISDGNAHSHDDEVRLPKGLIPRALVVAVKALYALIRENITEKESAGLLLQIIAELADAHETIDVIMSNFHGLFKFTQQAPFDTGPSPTGEVANGVLSRANLAPVEVQEVQWMYSYPEVLIMPQLYGSCAKELPGFDKALEVVKDFTEGTLDYGRRLHLYCGLLCVARRAYPHDVKFLPRTDSRIVFKTSAYRKLLRTLFKSINFVASPHAAGGVSGDRGGVSTTNMLLIQENNPTVSVLLLPFHGGDRYNEAFAFAHLSNWSDFGEAVIKYLECSGALDGPGRLSSKVLEEFISIVTRKIEDYELWLTNSPRDGPPFRFHREFVKRVLPILAKDAEFYPKFHPSSPEALPFSIRYLLDSSSSTVEANCPEKTDLGEDGLNGRPDPQFYKAVVNKFYAILRMKWQQGNSPPFPASLVSFGRVVGRLLSLPAIPLQMQSVFLLLVLTFRALSSQVQPLKELGRAVVKFLIGAALSEDSLPKSSSCGDVELAPVRGLACYPLFCEKVCKDEGLRKMIAELPPRPEFFCEVHYMALLPREPPRAPEPPGPEACVSSITGLAKPVPWTQRQLPWEEGKSTRQDFIEYLAVATGGGTYIELLGKSDNFFTENDDLPPFQFQYITHLLYIVEAAKGISAYRALLKTLGTWLGSVTLKRNKPILAKQLDLKALLLSGYERGVLIAVLPLVCKIIENVKESKIFRLPNPWTVSVLTAVAHLHRLPRLKMNRIFEIELLFKNLELPSPKIWLSSSSPSPFTQQPISDADLEQADKAARASRDGRDKLERASRGEVTCVAISAEALAKMVTIPDSILSQHNSLIPSKLSIGQAIERAIREILPAIERSVATGIKCSRQLVEKDYYSDRVEEPEGMRAIAEKMLRYVGRTPSSGIVPCKVMMAVNGYSLAHSLASVSSRVMLNSLLLENFFSLVRNGIEDPAEARSLALVLVRSNMDFISKVMSQVVQSLLVKMNVDTGFPPESVDKYAQKLPLLHFLPGGKSAVSWKVDQPAPAPAAAAGALGAKRPASAETFISTHVEDPFQIPPVSGLATSLVLKKFAECSTYLRRAVAQVLTFPPPMPAANSTDQPCLARGLAPSQPIPQAETLALGLLACLPSDHQIFSLVRSIRYLCRNAANKPEIYHTIGTKLLKSGNEAILQAEKASNPNRSIDQSAIILEIELAIFELLCSDWPGLRTLTSSFVMVPSYMNVNRVTLFVRFNLLNLDTLDKFLAAHLDNTQGVNANAVEFTIRVLHKLLVEHGYATCRHFSQCITKLSKVSSRVLAHKRTNIGTWNRMDLAEAKNRVLRECKNGKLRGESRVRSLTSLLKQYSAFQMANGHAAVAHRALPAPPFISDKVRQGAVALFTEWMAILAHHSGSGEGEFLRKLSKAGYLRLDEVTDMFYVTSLYLSLYMAHCGIVEYKSASEKFEKSDLAGKAFCDVFQRAVPLPAAGQPDMSYVKGWARLAIRMITLVDPNQISPVFVLQKLLHIVCRTLHKAASLSICVALQRPFYRLFDYIIRGIVGSGGSGVSLESHQIGLLQSVASALLLVSPLRVPDFAFSWMQLLSRLVPHLISTDLVVKRRSSAGVVSLKGPHLWECLSHLLVHLLEFLVQVDSCTALAGQEAALVYDAALFLFLYMYNNCGEFLAAYALRFNEAIVGDCFQLRNIICAALPAPASLGPQGTSAQGPGGGGENCAEWGPFRAPVMTPTTWLCGVPELKTAIDAYFYASGGKEHVSRICTSLLRAEAVEGGRYDAHLLNQTILYVSVVLPKYSGEASADTGRRLLLELASALDVQGKYLLAASIANYLRYNCKVTVFFHDLLVDLFLSDAPGGAMQEIIARILLARTLAPGPKPWGLRQLAKSFAASPKIDFWALPIVAAVPAVKALFGQAFHVL